MSIVSTSLHRVEPEVVGDLVIYDGWYVRKVWGTPRDYAAHKAGHWPIRFRLWYVDEMCRRVPAIIAAVDKGVEAHRQYVSNILDYRGKGYW